jgi:small conductance mechanosensitive channel
VFIISENQFRVGDVIDIEGFSGTVERIGVRSTVLRDPDGNVHYFPNGMVQHVINKTMGYSMARFTIAVTPETDIDRVVGIINKTGLALAAEPEWKDKVLEAPQYVMMGDFTSTAVNLIVSGKTQPSDQWSVVAEMRRRLLVKFEEKDIAIGTTLVTQVAAAKKKR